jgi:outer membrane protein assembly factor BamB
MSSDWVTHDEDIWFDFRGDSPQQLTAGRYYRGTVDGFAEFGVFVDLASGVTGLLHRSELDNQLETLDWESGDTVFVQVKQVRNNGNIDLGWSIRQSSSEFRGSWIHDPTGVNDGEPVESTGNDSTDAGSGTEATETSSVSVSVSTASTEDIEIVAEQTGADQMVARRALKASDGDPADAINRIESDKNNSPSEDKSFRERVGEPNENSSTGEPDRNSSPDGETQPPEPGTKQWHFETGNAIYSSPAVADGTVYIGSFDSNLYAVDTTSGTEQWRFETGRSVRSSPTVADGTVYIGSNDNYLYAVDTTDGTKQWCFETGDRIRSSPTVADGTVYVGSDDRHLYAVDTTSGTEQWRFKTGDSVWFSPTVVDGTVYLGSWDNHLYAVDVTDGTEQWRFETGSYISSSPMVADGTVYIGTGNHNLYAVDTTDGTEQWRFEAWVETENEDYYKSPPMPTVADGTVYVGNRDHNVYAVDAISGTEQWRFETGNKVRSSPTVAGGTVYVWSSDENLYAVDATSGTEQWRFKAGDRIDSSPTVVDGTVYIGSHDNHLYAVAAEHEQPAQTETQRVRQDSSIPSPGTGTARSQSDDSRRATSRRLPVGEMTEEIPPTQSESVASPPRRPDLTHAEMTIDEEIGSGGQAIIQTAQLPESKQPPSVVAVRELNTKATLTIEAAERFQSQADTWRTIDARERNKPRWEGSEHITGVIATGNEREVPWVAIEYMDGGDLAARLEEYPNGLPVQQALWLGEGICQGLEVAHSLGRVHLDVKPANVLLKDLGESEDQEQSCPWPKLADWGLARTLAEETGSMDARSPEYAAPEQFEPTEFGDPDQLTDIYQAGALMYALLSGEPPATGTQLRVMQQVLSKESFTPPSEQRSELPEIVDAVIGVALERDKTARYNSIRDFGDALSALRTGGRMPRRVLDRIEYKNSNRE